MQRLARAQDASSSQTSSEMYMLETDHVGQTHFQAGGQFYKKPVRGKAGKV